MGKDSAVKLSMEDEVKNLKKHMGAVLMAVKGLKGTIKVLEKRISNKENVSWLIWQIWWQHTEKKLKIVRNMHSIIY